MDKANTSRKIAVGVVDKQPAVLEYALREADRAGCGITLVHAYSVPPSAMGSIYGLDIPEMFRAGGEEVLAEAARYLKENGAKSPVEQVLIRGYAPAVLETAARSARMMVIGPDESKPWYFRLLEGRVAHQLAEHAECPVVVVPDTDEQISEDAPVVVMVDGETSSHGPLQFAFETAAARGAELIVLHVAAPDERGGDTEWEAVRRVADTWYDRHPQVRGGSEVVRGDVHDIAINRASGAAVLVIGRPGERRVSDVFMDSLAQELIAESGSPVAVVPGDYRG